VGFCATEKLILKTRISLECISPRPLMLAISIGLLTVAQMPGQTDRKVTQLADGVYEIEHQDSGAGFASGNTTVIIGERQVFVVDSCLLPSAAREDIAQIRQWTDKPVAFVLNTHFHNDHNFGNRAYMDAFPALTIIAHVETKKDMDMFGPGSASREERSTASVQKILDTGKTRDGRALTEEETAEVKNVLAQRLPVMEELGKVKFQSATLTFDHDFTIDLGNREVQVKFLGRGNTSGDAVAYLPKEKIVVAGDLVVHPIPHIYDGYPIEWIQTMQNLAQLDADTIVPGHGPIMHDKSYIFLIRDFLKSAVDQMDAKLKQTGPAMFRTLDEVKGSVDLTPFRQRFAGDDKDLAAAFDDMAAHLIKVVFEEASLR
jgi:cyclase